MSTSVSVPRPGNTMRRFFESIPSGLVLPGMLGAIFLSYCCVCAVCMVSEISGLYIHFGCKYNETQNVAIRQFVQLRFFCS